MISKDPSAEQPAAWDELWRRLLAVETPTDKAPVETPEQPDLPRQSDLVASEVNSK